MTQVNNEVVPEVEKAIEEWLDTTFSTALAHLDGYIYASAA